MPEHDDSDVSYMDVVKGEEPDVAEVVTSKVQAETVLSAADGIRRQRTKCLSYVTACLEGQKTQGNSQLLGLSRSYVSRIEKRAITKISPGMSAFA